MSQTIDPGAGFRPQDRAMAKSGVRSTPPSVRNFQSGGSDGALEQKSRRVPTGNNINRLVVVVELFQKLLLAVSLSSKVRKASSLAILLAKEFVHRWTISDASAMSQSANRSDIPHSFISADPDARVLGTIVRVESELE